MDSLTQIVLGASIGEAICGRRAGNKALLWGAIAGTIPDLDILASPFLDMVGELYYHRSITHSILFALLVSPVLGWLLTRLYKNSPATYLDWTLLFFLGFITHILLDCFTTWGTKVFYPFSDYAVSFHNIFVIDPLYTIPFLICVTAVLFYSRNDRRRRLWNNAGLIISTAYMAITLVNKAVVNSVFKNSLEKKGINYIRYSTKPTPFNAILWSVTAETEQGYYTGYYSLLDDNKDIEFRFFPKNHHLLDPYLGHPELRKLIRITEGYYTVEAMENMLVMNDLRFGQLDGWGEGKEDFTFSYLIYPSEGNITFSQKPNDMKKARSLMGALWQRIKGEKS